MPRAGGLPEEQADAVRLDAWLLSYCGKSRVSSVSRREVQRNITPVRLRKTERLNQALRELCEADRIREICGGRQKMISDNAPLSDKEGTKERMEMAAPLQLQKMIALRQVWEEVLQEEGIRPEIMAQAYKGLHHLAFDWLDFIVEDMKLPPDPETLKEYRGVLKGCLEKVG